MKGILFLFLALLISCQGQEKINSPFESTKLSEQPEKGIVGEPLLAGIQKKEGLFYVKGTYYFGEIPVDRGANGPPLIENIGMLLANVIIKIGGNFDVEMESYPVDLSDIDLTTVQDIRIEAVRLNILENPSGKADLKFIKDLKIKTEHKNIGIVNILSYNRERDGSCGPACIDFSTYGGNLIDIIEDETSLQIIPELKIGSVPKDSFVLGGYVKLRIGLKLPL